MNAEDFDPDLRTPVWQGCGFCFALIVIVAALVYEVTR